MHQFNKYNKNVTIMNLNSKNNFYAYIRSQDSITAKAGTPYYIGKGCGMRAFKKHRNGIKVNKDNATAKFIKGTRPMII
jgi:hypothetical protein